MCDEVEALVLCLGTPVSRGQCGPVGIVDLLRFGHGLPVVAASKKLDCRRMVGQRMIYKGRLPLLLSPAPRPPPGPCLKIPAFPNHPVLSLPRAEPQQPHPPRNGAYGPEVSTETYVPLTSFTCRRSVNQPSQGDWHCTHRFEDKTESYHYVNKCVRV